MSNNSKLKKWEQDYIRLNAPEKDVQEIADALGVSPGTVYKYGKHLEVRFKNSRKEVDEDAKLFIQEPTAVDSGRPPSVYSNIPSPYGIADELHRSPKNKKYE